MGESLIINHLTLGTKFLNNAVNLEGIPIKHSIGNQAQTTRFVHDLLVLTSGKFPLVTKENTTRKAMAILALIELELNPAT